MGATPASGTAVPKVQIDKRTDTLLATANNLDEAEQVRRLVLNSSRRTWVFVSRNKDETYSIAATTETGGKLSDVLTSELTDKCSAFLEEARTIELDPEELTYVPRLLEAVNPIDDNDVHK